MHLACHLYWKGLFGEVDAEAIDTEANSALATDAIDMDIENDVADGGVIVNNDATANNIGTLCMFHLT